MLHQGCNCHYAFVLSKESRGKPIALLMTGCLKIKTWRRSLTSKCDESVNAANGQPWMLTKCEKAAGVRRSRRIARLR